MSASLTYRFTGDQVNAALSSWLQRNHPEILQAMGALGQKITMKIEMVPSACQSGGDLSLTVTWAQDPLAKWAHEEPA